MSQSSPHLISVRAIEDIIQVEKNNEKLPKVIESEILKDKVEEADHSLNKFNTNCSLAENQFCLPKVIEGNVIENSDIKVRKRVEGKGSEGDHQNSEFIQLEDVKITDKMDSELDLKSWPSDSDITIIRMKKEYRTELSTRVTWEEERNLTENSSSKNFDWESHSLINLANITVKEKDDAERLTPFTIWSKIDNLHNESGVPNPNSELLRKEPIFSNLRYPEQTTNLLSHPSDEFTIYVPVSSEENQSSEQSFYKPTTDILPILDEKITMLYRTESSSSVNEKSVQKEKGTVSEFSPSGNKSSHPGKLKFLRSFFNFFFKCGSKKKSLDYNN